MGAEILLETRVSGSLEQKKRLELEKRATVMGL